MPISQLNRAVQTALLCLFSVAYAQNLLSATLIGPFRTPADAELVRAQLGMPSTTESRLSRQPIDYIVVSDRTGPQLARALLTELQRSGIEDVVYIRTGEFGGRVSAGVYVGTESPARRVRQLAALGFTFQTMPRETREVSLTFVSTTGEVSPEVQAAIENSLGYNLAVEQMADVIIRSKPPVDVEVPASVATAPIIESEPQVTQTVDVAVDRTVENSFVPVVPITADTQPLSLGYPQTEQDKQPVGEPLANAADVPVEPVVTAATESSGITAEEIAPEDIATEAIARGNIAPEDMAPEDMAPEDMAPANEKAPVNLLLPGILVAVIVLIAGALFMLSRRGTRRTSADDTTELPPLQQAAAISIPGHSIPEPPSPPAEAPMAATDNQSHDKSLLESLDASDRRAIDLVGDLVALAQIDRTTNNGFDLDAMLLGLINDARSVHSISTIRYRPTSVLPGVACNEDALRRLLGILVQQAVSFDDAAHILITAAYTVNPVGQLEIVLINEAALLGEAEVSEIRDTTTRMGMRFSIAEQIAEKMGGKIDLSSRFGMGTRLNLVLDMQEARHSTSKSGSSSLTVTAAEQKAVQLAEEFQHAKSAKRTLGEEPLPGMQVETNDPVELFVSQLEHQLKEIETARAIGDLDSLTRIAKWTARYAGGTGMTNLAEQMTAFYRAMAQGQELIALDQLTTLHMAISHVQLEKQAAVQSNTA